LLLVLNPQSPQSAIRKLRDQLDLLLWHSALTAGDYV
jgi:hypothetical protein